MVKKLIVLALFVLMGVAWVAAPFGYEGGLTGLDSFKMSLDLGFGELGNILLFALTLIPALAAVVGIIAVLLGKLNVARNVAAGLAAVMVICMLLSIFGINVANEINPLWKDFDWGFYGMSLLALGVTFVPKQK